MKVKDFITNTYEEYAKIHGDCFASLKVYRDMKNVIDTAVRESHIEIAKDLLKEGMPIEKISQILKLSTTEVEKLRNN